VTQPTDGQGAARTSLTTDLIDVEQITVRRFRLGSVGGGGAPVSYQSTKAHAVIGSSSSADLSVDDKAVSRFHCEIRIVGGAAVIRDLDSSNGTWVDGVRVVHAFLRKGAIVRFGRTELRFDFGEGYVEIPLSKNNHFGELVGGSVAMRAIFALLEKVAASDATVLLLGETGTGKDVAAVAIHEASARRAGPFIAVNCGAIPPGLLESELFGHERGAFTGAERQRIGAFEAASGGTLFLDEIGDLSLDVQPTLLRALESGVIHRVGRTAEVAVDVRIIAATNRDLRNEVNAGRFRSDLLYRLAVFEIALPPLRERMEDLRVLVEHLLGTLAPGDDDVALQSRVGKLVAEAEHHGWPGNIRELKNYLARCVALDTEVALFSAESLPSTPPPIDVARPLREVRERWQRFLERNYLEAMLERHDRNVSAAARAAGVDRAQFYRLMWRNGLR